MNTTTDLCPTVPSASDLLPDGTELMWYRLERVLGRGGFAVTYLAQDLHLQQRVAIKEFLPAGLAHRSGSDVCANPGCEADFIWGRERFLAEAQTLARFRHPNIVRVVSFFEANNTAYLVMDFEEGQSLAQSLSVRPAVSEAALMALLLPLVDGLEVLHRAGFIHRDIKPENIYVRSDGSPVLLDFGAARQALGGQTQSLTALLSPGYAPLEQYFSQKDRQGPWSDIYALGAVLYRIISGQKPPEASLRSNYQINGMDDPLKPASQIGLGRYSRDLLNAIDQSLRLREAERPQSLGEWRAMMPAPDPGISSPGREKADQTVPGRSSEARAPATSALANRATPQRGAPPERVESEPGGGRRWLVWLLVLFAVGIAYLTMRPPAGEKAAAMPPQALPSAKVAPLPPAPPPVERPSPDPAPSENRPQLADERRVPSGASGGGFSADSKLRTCRTDIERYCPDLVPGDGRFVACMRDNLHRVSPGCRRLILERQRPRPPRSE